MFRRTFQLAAGFARRWARPVILLGGATLLAQLTYCGVAEKNPNAPGKLPSLTTATSEHPEGYTTVYELAPGSEVLLQGHTNVVPWSSRSSQPTARVALDVSDAVVQRLFDKLQAGQLSADQLRVSSGRPPLAELSVPVTSLHGSSAGMDHDMNSALKAAQFPSITYQLETIHGAKPSRDVNSGRPAFELGITGALTVAGVQRDVATKLIIEQDADHHYLVQAEVPIRMTDFGVKPPVALFGLIRAQDALTVVFQLKFIQAK